MQLYTSTHTQKQLLNSLNGLASSQVNFGLSPDKRSNNSIDSFQSAQLNSAIHFGKISELLDPVRKLTSSLRNDWDSIAWLTTLQPSDIQSITGVELSRLIANPGDNKVTTGHIAFTEPRLDTDGTTHLAEYYFVLRDREHEIKCSLNGRDCIEFTLQKGQEGKPNTIKKLEFRDEKGKLRVFHTDSIWRLPATLPRPDFLATLFGDLLGLQKSLNMLVDAIEKASVDQPAEQ